MGRDQEYVWLGLAKALESGMETYLRRKERQETQQLREMAFQQRKSGVQRRHEDRQRLRQQISKLSAQRKEEKEQGPAMTEQNLFKRFGTGEAPDMVREALRELGVDAMNTDPGTWAAVMREIEEKNPTELPATIDANERMKEIRGAFDETTKTFAVAPSEALSQSLQEQRERDEQIREMKGRRGQATKAKEGIEERIRRLHWQLQRDIESGKVQPPQGPPPPGQQMPGQQQSGSPFGMGMATPQAQQGLNVEQFQQLPQGEGTTMQDQAQLGALATHFNTIMGLSPGGATMTELAQAYQWFAQNSQIAKLPVDIELYSQGLPGAQQPGGPNAMREILG